MSQPRTLFLALAMVLTSACDPEVDGPDDAADDPSLSSSSYLDRVNAIIDVVDAETYDVDASDTLYHETCWSCHSYGGLTSPVGEEKSAVGGFRRGREYVVERVLLGADASADSPGMPAFDHFTNEEIAGIVARLQKSADLAEEWD